ncbi:MAG: MoxR family ATPase [Elusimicrobiota bacterium]|nr:MoxR family ATPase [Elusimicrobiota bacterium]
MTEKKEKELIEKLARARVTILEQLKKVIVGQQDIVDLILTGMFAGGHCLIIGVPGLAKTKIVHSLADILDLNFSRIQFTPDLMPSDITGTEVIEQDKATGQREFRFIKGPLFANIILADEINRTPPKTQAALLQAMQEYSVTAGARTFELKRPFFVLATQNPIEQEGTYPLPEAQLDRFFFNIRIDYPGREEEKDIVKLTTYGEDAPLEKVLSAEEIVKLQKIVRDIPVADEVIEYAVNLVSLSRPEGKDEFIDSYVAWGAGPRASQYLVLGSKARAILRGSYNVSTDDILALAHPVLRHRIIPNFNAESEGIDSDHIINHLLESVD